MHVQSAEKPAVELTAINKDSTPTEATPALFKIIYAHETSRPEGSASKIAKAEPCMEFVGERILRSPSYRTLAIASRIIKEVLLKYQSVDPNTGAHTHPGQVQEIEGSVAKRARKLLCYVNHFEEVRRKKNEPDPYPGPHSEQELFDISNLTREEETMSLAQIQNLYPIKSPAKSKMPVQKDRRVKRSFKCCKQCGARFLAKRSDQEFHARKCLRRYLRLHPAHAVPIPANALLEPA
jgi:hypothetical protein